MKYCLYHLEPITRLNRFSRGEVRRGVLLNHEGAYFDYHPWTQFGDKSVEDFLASLKKDGRNSQVSNLMALDKRRSEIKHESFFNHSFNKIGECSKIKYTDEKSLVFFLDEALKDSKVRVDFNNVLNLSFGRSYKS